jgi:FtsZ-binding cell division protein ZapB
MEIQMTDQQHEKLLETGSRFLRGFHQEHARDSASKRTEHFRAKLSGWRETITAVFGKKVSDRLAKELRLRTGLSIPHCGPLTADGSSYIADDSESDSYVGPVPQVELANRQFELRVFETVGS